MKGALKPEAAAALIPEGASLMIGGFMAVGTPERLIDALVARGVGKLTIIANDTAMPGKGIEVSGKSRNQSFSFTGSHLSNLSLVQYNTTN